LYVLYEGYGYSVASLYCLGFLTGAVTAPITGPLVDKFGRKRSALLYCALEMFINMLEQYPFLSGLIVSRMVGGITTNLLSSVFEAWFDTEFRNRNFDESKYETIMRDSVIVSNFAAIASGYLAHILAENLGPVGPFEGAVTCTGFALFVIAFAWSENYGTLHQSKTEEKSHRVMDYLADATKLFKHDSKLLRIGIIQGLSVGSLHIFIFLWSPTLIDLAKQVSAGTFGTDKEGLPAFGLIFGYFMIAGVIGGILSPFVRKAVSKMIGRTALDENTRPAGIELMAGSCYIILGFLLLVPCLVSVEDSESFTIALISFIIYELVGGICIPCEGVLRSYYIPSSSRATMMTLPRMVVNIAVAVGVLSTTQMQ
jgi:MFS transporter, MFS domain-containing protein family, molybdate-anion transporter